MPFLARNTDDFDANRVTANVVYKQSLFDNQQLTFQTTANPTSESPLPNTTEPSDDISSDCLPLLDNSVQSATASYCEATS
eukprot:4236498-Pleurochrysis_carterae.AAC.1